MSAAAERAFTGVLVQDAETAFALSDEMGLTVSAFTDADCIRVWRAAIDLRSRGKIVVSPVLVEAMGGDDANNMALIAELEAVCPTTAYARHYAEQVAEAARGRRAKDAATMALERFEKDGAAEPCLPSWRRGTSWPFEYRNRPS